MGEISSGTPQGEDTFPASVASSGSEEYEEEEQYIFLMLLDEQKKRVLMLEENSEWYLPCFKYPYRSGEHKPDACLQLQKKLGVDPSQPYFTA